jgi:hypothetical protein
MRNSLGTRNFLGTECRIPLVASVLVVVLGLSRCGSGPIEDTKGRTGGGTGGVPAGGSSESGAGASTGASPVIGGSAAVSEDLPHICVRNRGTLNIIEVFAGE